MHFVEIIIEYLPIFMFLTMGVLLFIGYPVGFILGGVAITYGFIGYIFLIKHKTELNRGLKRELKGPKPPNKDCWPLPWGWASEHKTL